MHDIFTPCLSGFLVAIKVDYCKPTGITNLNFTFLLPNVTPYPTTNTIWLT